MSEPTVAGYTEEQAKEYSRYVATEAIFIGGARAFNPGDPVPTSHIDNGVVDKSQVAGATTKAAAAAQTKEG